VSYWWVWTPLLIVPVAIAIEWRRIVAEDRRLRAEYDDWYRRQTAHLDSARSALGADVKRETSILLNNSECVVKSVEDLKARITKDAP
jgi:hypothetical protein